MASANLSGKTCLVTGASGFIGSHLCEELVKQGAIVKALLHTPCDGIWASSFQCKLGEQQIPKQAMEDVEIVFHLAGRAHSIAEQRSQDNLYTKLMLQALELYLRQHAMQMLTNLFSSAV